jgi:hypothetical protein
MRAQGLGSDRDTDVVSAVARVCALQAQAVPAARLGVRVRTARLAAAAVDRAVADAAVVRTWMMRGTLHMLAAADFGWLVGLLGPVNVRAGQRRRGQLGLDDHLCARALTALESVLAGGTASTRARLVARLAEHGVLIDPKSQAPAHLLAFAANSGLICRGPDVDNDEPTYVLARDWLGDAACAPVDRSVALARLARRYLAGYGPAGMPDFAAWSGLPRADAGTALAALADDTVRIDTERGPMFALGDPVADAPPPRLLGQFDAVLLGYRDRELLLDERYAKRINAGGGMIGAAAVVGGRVAGTWKLRRSGARCAVVVEPFEDIPAAACSGLESEAADIGRFLGEPVDFRLATS